MKSYSSIAENKQKDLNIYDSEEIILEVKDLKVNFKMDEGILEAVSGVDFIIKKVEHLALLVRVVVEKA